ncbi:uncharacterized protein LOC129793730 [Lutzomyia longipalpis]|uniref:Uncharacterized protein n=2 Tax=Lutzomyia longipalpis TaxID=7200 RepID=A0A1B0CIG0_LUTLO|nr:uncharacterized protein LOC129793730 [Lutzomyia longipalpis]
MSEEAGEAPLPNLDNLRKLMKSGDFKMPKLDDLLKVLDKMDLPEDQKEKLRQNLIDNKFTPRPNYLIFIITVSILLLIFVFIGRKLYRHLKAKEEKQSGKKKVKEGKKGSKQPKEDSKKGKKSQDDREKSPKKKK